MYPAEIDAGITFAELGIDLSRCRNLAACDVHCPWCHHTRQSTEGQRDREMSVNVTRGTMTCHHCGKRTGLGEQAREKGRTPMTGTPDFRRATVTPVTQTVSPDTNLCAKPIDEGRELAPDLHDWAIAWHEEQGISAGTVKAFGIRSSEWVDDAGETQRAIHYPYRVDGQLVNVKRRRLPKKFTQVGGASRSLFHIDAAEGNDRIVIVEGEKDCLAVAEAGHGWVAVSAADGAPGKNRETGIVAEVGSKISAFREPKSKRVLDAAKRIVIAVDGDEEGTKFRDGEGGILDELGRARCWIVTWPEGCKDATDVLNRLGPEALDKVLGSAKPADLPGVTSFMSEWEGLESIHAHGDQPGLSTGFPNLDARYTIRLGTMTTGTGIPGNGKTTFFLDLLTRVAHRHGLKAAIFSPESGTTASLFAKLVRAVADAPVVPCDFQVDKATLREAAEWVADHFWRIDAAKTDDDDYQVITVPELIKRLEGLVLREGISIAYIDPWNRLEASRPGGMTETEYVAWSINMFSRFARRHNVAVIIVCHPHKMPDAVYGRDEPIPSPYNIAGSAHWYNMSDYILGIGRAKYGDMMADPPVPKNRCTVAVMKVRDEITGDELGDCWFRYDGKSGRFYPEEEFIPTTAGNRPYMKEWTLEQIAGYAEARANAPVHAPVAAIRAPVGDANGNQALWDDGPPTGP
jgi:twinkle protein